MKKLACLLVIYCVINSIIVDAGGGKSIVVYMKDQSKSNSDIMSVEVNEELFIDILAQVKLKNKRASPVKNIDSAKDFINMVSGENCKCQCLCCDTTITKPPTPRTTATSKTRTTQTTRRTTEMTRTTPGKYLPPKTLPFVPSTYLPPTKGTTEERPSTTTRTYRYVPVTHGFKTWSIQPWTPYPSKSYIVKSFRTQPPKFAYYAPANQLYYPSEGLKLSDDGKTSNAVTPIPIPSQNLIY